MANINNNLALHFNLTTANNLVTRNIVNRHGKQVVEVDINACCEYMKIRMFPLSDGDHIVYEGGKMIRKPNKTIDDVYLKRLPDEVRKWYNKVRKDVYTVINDLWAPTVDAVNNTINLCGGFKYKTPKKFADCSKQAQDAAMFFINDYMYDVLADRKKDMLNYFLDWIANMCQGNKNDSLIYLKSPEGTGKSTLVDFLHYHVLGDKVYLEAQPTVLTTDNNELLCGKLLVVFEELPVFSDAAWSGVSGKLKAKITGKTDTYSNKYVKAYEADNINNYIVNTNVEALKHSEGRRFFIVDISTRRLLDHAYYGDLRDLCFTDEVGEAFFSLMVERDVSKFHAQKCMPVTAGKLNAIANRLDNVFAFIKETYIRNKIGIKANLKQLYEDYTIFMANKDRGCKTKIDFVAKLKEVQIFSKLINGNNKYNITYEQLKTIADKHKWIHELDEMPEDEKKEVKKQTFMEKKTTVTVNNDVSYSVKKEYPQEDIIGAYYQEIKQFRKEYENTLQLVKNYQLPKKKPPTKSNEDDCDEVDDDKFINNCVILEPDTTPVDEEVKQIINKHKKPKQPVNDDDYDEFMGDSFSLFLK